MNRNDETSQVDQKKPRVSISGRIRERDRLRKQTPEYVKRREEMLAVFGKKSPANSRTLILKKIRNWLRTSIGIDWWWQSPDSEDTGHTIGIQWWRGLDAPPVFIYRKDQDYWSSLTMCFRLISRSLCIEFRLQKQPYRNIEEYLAWKKTGAKQ